VLALVMLASALNLSGLFEFGISAQGTGADLASRPGLAGAFFTGVLAVVVAAPCTGPFMASTIGWALAQSEVTALAVFAALGVGLAAPFVALAFAPGLYRLMPRPGAWMEGLRKALAFPMYGAAAWLAWVFVEEAGSGSLPYLFAAALLLAFGFWLWGVSQRTQIAGNRAAAIGGAIGALGLAVVTLNLGPKPMAAASAVGSTGEVQAWTPTRPAELQAQGRPVFVDFTAAWCVTCKVNEAGALASPAVKAAFQKTGTIYLRADWTNRNAEIAHALQAQGRAGVPLYLVYSRRGGAPAILPQVLTEGDLLKALEAAGR
jgi:thiol:disulfide interchange protein DsbD